MQLPTLLYPALLYALRRSFYYPFTKQLTALNVGKQQVGKSRASLREVYGIARSIGTWENINAVLLVMGIFYVNLQQVCKGVFWLYLAIFFMSFFQKVFVINLFFSY